MLRDLVLLESRCSGTVIIFEHRSLTALFGDLQEEAATLQESGAYRFRNSDYRLGKFGNLSSPFDHLVADPGPVLGTIHRDRALLQTLREMTVPDLLPSRSAYLYYYYGDYNLLHRDVPSCLVTALCPLGDFDEPLFVYPDQVATETAELRARAIASDGFPPGGEEIHLRLGAVTLIRGSVLPHARPPWKRRSPGTLMTLCYDSALSFRTREPTVN